MADNKFKQELEKQSIEKLNTLSKDAKRAYAKKERFVNMVLGIIIFLFFGGIATFLLYLGFNNDIGSLVCGIFVFVLVAGFLIYLIIYCVKKDDDLALLSIKRET